MLYIFDLGNVIVDIDFNRVLGAWSDLTRVPLATLKKSFHMGEAFHQHERGEISDEAFAEALCHVVRYSQPSHDLVADNPFPSMVEPCHGTHSHTHALSQAIPQIAKTELPLQHLLYVFALVPLTLPDALSWSIPPSFCLKPGPRESRLTAGTITDDTR